MLPLAVLRAAGALLGRIVYAASPAYRRRLVANLEQAGYGEASAVRHRAVAEAGRMVGELPWIWARSPAEIARRITCDSVRVFDEAEAALTVVIEAFPFDSEIRARLADIHEQRGDDDAARAEYIRLLELNPTAEWRDRALDWLGLAEARRLREAGQYDGALALVEPLLDGAAGTGPYPRRRRTPGRCRGSLARAVVAGAGPRRGATRSGPCAGGHRA